MTTQAITMPNPVFALEKMWYSEDDMNPTICVELTPVAAQHLENLGVSFPAIGMGAGTEGMINSQLPVCEADSQQYLGSDLAEDVLAHLAEDVREAVMDFINEVLDLASNKLEA